VRHFLPKLLCGAVAAALTQFAAAQTTTQGTTGADQPTNGHPRGHVNIHQRGVQNSNQIGSGNQSSQVLGNDNQSATVQGSDNQTTQQGDQSQSTQQQGTGNTAGNTVQSGKQNQSAVGTGNQQNQQYGSGNQSAQGSTASGDNEQNRQYGERRSRGDRDRHDKGWHKGWSKKGGDDDK
jgi:hypothetical protein